MKAKSLGVGVVLALAVAGTACRADDGPEGEIIKLRAKVKELEAANQTLRAEVARLKGILYKIPEKKPDKTRLDKDLQALSNLYKTLNEKPGDKAVLEEAAVLAKQLGSYQPGNVLIWQVFLRTRTLKDGLSLTEAFLLLGPPTSLSNEYVGWYFNPRNRHVAPYLNAKVTKQGLTEWKITNR